MSQLPLSVVVPCFGRAVLTRRLLDSFVRSADAFEVVLVDDASPESVASIAAEYALRLNIRVVRHEANRGPAAARNTGIHAASHDILAFTDNDCEVEPDWARHLFVYLRDAPRSVAGVGGRVLAAGNDVFGRYFTYHKILDPFLSEGRYLYVVTANCALRRATIVEVGGFDEVIRVPGGEDPGVCFKLLAAGHQLHYRPEAVVRHHYRIGLRDFARTFFRYGAGCRRQTEAFGAGVGSATPAVVGFGGM